MSIASEIDNYRNGLSDAYDAVNDMSGIIPQDKNMNNLDTAIRTIPIGTTPNDGVLTITQNGVTIQTFSANQSTNATAALTDTTYSAMTGASSGAAGTSGLVPAPAAGDEGKFLQGDGTWATPTDTTYTAGTNIQISAQNVISATDTTYSAFTGATSSVAGSAGLVPAPAAGDQGKALLGDGTWGDPAAKLVEMSYGESSAWAKFIAAYNAGSIVYCRASSNANPGTGSQTRKAFMAYVNNATSPTSVEFQYVRSNSSKSDSSQCDQVFVYTLSNSNGGTWSVATRDMAPKILVDATLNKTFSGGANASVTLGAKAMAGATSGTAGTAGYVPAPAAGDQNKVLKGDGTWVDQLYAETIAPATPVPSISSSMIDWSTTGLNYSTVEQATPFTWIDGKTIYKKTIEVNNITSTSQNVTHGISNLGTVVKAEGTHYNSSFGYQPITRNLPQADSGWGSGIGDINSTNFTLFFGASYTLSDITAWVTLYYTKSS